MHGFQKTKITSCKLWEILSSVTLSLMLFAIACFASASDNDVPSLDLGLSEQHQRVSLRPYFEYLKVDGKRIKVEELDRYKDDWLNPAQQEINNFDNNDFWMRVTLRNSSDKKKEFLLVHENPQNFRFNVYQEKDYVVKHLYQLGAKLPFEQRPFDHRLFVMPFEIEPGQQIKIFINSNVASREFLTRTYLWDRDLFFETTHLSDLGHIFYFGIVLVMAVYNLVVFFIVREKDYLFYTLFVFGMALSFLGVTGYGYQLIWPGSPWFNERVMLLGLGLMLSFAGWFSIEFLNLKEHFPKITSVLHVLGIIVMIESVLLLIIPFENKTIFLRLISVSAMPIYFISWFAGLLSWRRQPDFSTRIYLIAWSLLLAALTLSIIHELIFRLFDGPIFVYLQISQCIEVVLLSMALAQRISTHKVSEGVAQGKLEAKSKFLARMSHEIRTPMNGILGMSEILRQRLPQGEDQHLSEVIHSSAKSLQLVINDILDYSKLEAGKVSVQNKAFDLRKLLEETNEMFALQAKEKSLVVGVDIKGDVPQYFVGDPLRIRQVLINLIGNAIKYTKGGFVKTTASYVNRELIIEVVDSGIGIAHDQMKHLFNPFEQAENNNLSRESSTGLGLAISKELVELMGGNIHVHSVIKHGSRFWFELPLAVANTVDDDELEEGLENRDINKLRILVVEDNKINQQVVLSMLKNIGLEADMVENGVAAVALYKAQAAYIDLILMDCEMPEMDGFEATRQIRQWEDDKGIEETPIVALTAHTLHQELEECFKSGMNDLLLKPITMTSLRQTLERHA